MNAKISFGISAVIIASVIASSISFSSSPKIANTDNSGVPSKTLRIAYFPNVNHAQAVLGFENGEFQKELLKDGITVKPQVFTAGPSVIVVRSDSGIKSSKDFSGKKFASPQLGNTQDISLRSYLLQSGHNTKENGGDVEVTSANLQDILTLFLRKQIDGAWVPEPWGAILHKDAKGIIFLDERSLWRDGKFVTANIIV